MPFEIQPREKPRSLWPAIGLGVVVLALIALAITWLGRGSPAPSTAPQNLPFGSPERAYAPQLKFENLNLSRFANMFDQEVTYVAGDVENQGNRTVLDVQVTFVFQDVNGKLVHAETVPLLGLRPVPIPPGGKQSFRVGFEQLPDTWNMRDPDLRVSGLILK